MRRILFAVSALLAVVVPVKVGGALEVKDRLIDQPVLICDDLKVPKTLLYWLARGGGTRHKEALDNLRAITTALMGDRVPLTFDEKKFFCDVGTLMVIVGTAREYKVTIERKDYVILSAQKAVTPVERVYLIPVEVLTSL